MAEISANGVRLHVQRIGTGPRTVVFLHGLVMDNLSSWYFTVANRAAKHAEVILYDLRGHGLSERPKTGYRIADMVEDLNALLSALGVVRPVDLVANSYGGAIAVAFALAQPERMSSLVLVDSHVQAKGWGDQMAATLELRGEERDRMIAQAFKNWLGRHSRRKSTRLAKTAEALVYGTSLVDDLRASAEIPDADLAAIACPSLGLYGQESDILHLAERLAKTLPAFELHVFPGCTHSVLWEATTRLRDHIVAWLAAPRAGR